MAALVKLLGDKLTLHGQEVDVASLATSHKYIGLYFSAHVRAPLRDANLTVAPVVRPVPRLHARAGQILQGLEAQGPRGRLRVERPRRRWL